MSRSFRFFLIFGLLLSLGACSSSLTAEGDSADDIIEEVDAGTDAVPASHIEIASKEVEITTPQVNQTAPIASDLSSDLSKNTQVVTQEVSQARTHPASAPAVVPSPVAASAVAQASHIIRPGETLMMIAYQVYGDIFRWKEIYHANKDKIRNPNSLPVGVALTTENIPSNGNALPKGRKYEVKVGDTLRSIARSVYGTQHKWQKIWQNNRRDIKNPNKIFKGFLIYYTMSLKDLAEYRHFKGVTARVQRVQVQNRRRSSHVVRRQIPSTIHPVARSVIYPVIHPVIQGPQPASVMGAEENSERATEATHSSVSVLAAPPASAPTVVAMPPLPSHLNEQLGQ